MPMRAVPLKGTPPFPPTSIARTFPLERCVSFCRKTTETGGLEDRAEVPAPGQHPKIRAEAQGTSKILCLTYDDK